MIDKKEFFTKYSITEEMFLDSGLEWAALCEIYDNYIGLRTTLEPNMTFISNCLQLLPAVHSVKYRLKDAEHLIEKLIRKKASQVTAETYLQHVTDLIGIRVLHLFKEEFVEIHEHVTKTWKLKEKPQANVRKGDPVAFINALKKAGCKIREHRLGYRSIHYVVKASPSKQTCFAEIQVRTIFEEGWSEIDHRMRYPYDTGNLLLEQFLVIFNRLAGSADEMGEFIRVLKRTLAERDDLYAEDMKNKEGVIFELEKKIAKLKIEKSERHDLNTSLHQLKNLNFDLSNPIFDPFASFNLESQLRMDLSEFLQRLVMPSIASFPSRPILPEQNGQDKEKSSDKKPSKPRTSQSSGSENDIPTADDTKDEVKQRE